MLKEILIILKLMQVADRIHTVNEYYFSKKLAEIEELNKAGKQIINLGIGSPDLPPHPSVIETLQTEAGKPNNHAYQSYRGALVLRQAISNWYKNNYDVALNPQTNILPLIGSKEGIMHVCMTYAQAGVRVLVPNPGYPTYTSAATLAGAQVFNYNLSQENNWLPNLQELTQLSTPYKTICILNYPHMPSGASASVHFFETIVAWAKEHNVLLLHDNPYSFILNNKPISILNATGALDVALELNSLSKSHNLAGWRVGMLCGHANRINEIIKFKSNMDSGMFLPVQLAAAQALNLGNSWHQQLNTIYTQRKQIAEQLLQKIQASYSQNQSGLFIWARCAPQFENGYAMSDYFLYNHQIFITPGGIFGEAGNNYIRISLCATEEKLLQAIIQINKV
jgi:LL-diaminopimelate aminotransferase